MFVYIYANYNGINYYLTDMLNKYV